MDIKELVSGIIEQIEEGIIAANLKLERKTFLMPEEIEIETCIGSDNAPTKITFKTKLFKQKVKDGKEEENNNG